MPKRSNPLGQLEQSLAALEEFSKTAPELVASLRDTLERYKGGEVDSAALYDAATALSGPFTQAHTKHFDVLWTTEDIDRDEGARRLRNEWIQSGRVFTPKSPIECDLWRKFHEFKQQGYRFVVMYGDKSGMGSHPIEAIENDQDARRILSHIQFDRELSLMALLDTEQSFQAQWPFVPGLIQQPQDLYHHPVISLPRDEAEAKPDGDYIDGVATRVDEHMLLR